ncbi:MAG: DUF58 domain-containing protein [Chloroflexota bacterium]
MKRLAYFLRAARRFFRRNQPLWIPLRSGALRVTARHWVLLFAWVVVVILAYQTGRDIFFRVAYLLLAVEVFSFIWAAYNIATFRLERQTITPRSQVGRFVEEQFLSHNTGRLTKPWIEVRDESELPAHRASRVLNALGARVRWGWTVRTVCRRRGRFRMGPVTIATGDPFGLFVFHRRLRDTTGAVTVYPATVDLVTFAPAQGQLPGGEALQRRTHHITTNVAGTREYAPGDSFNRIHWRSTARMERLIVKEFELDPSADVWIYLDMEREVQASRWYEEIWNERDLSSLWLRSQQLRLPPSTEEYGVTIAASIAKYFLRQQRAVGFAAYGHEREIVQPDRGERQLQRLLQVLAVLRAEGRIRFADLLTLEGARLGRHNTLIAITPSAELEHVRVLREMKRRGLRVIVILADANTFGGHAETDRAAIELLASGARTYVVREGDDLSAVLGK